MVRTEAAHLKMEPLLIGSYCHPFRRMGSLSIRLSAFQRSTAQQTSLLLLVQKTIDKLMKTTRFSAFAAAALFALGSLTADAQQFKTPAPSPAQTVKQAFGLGEVTIDYSRPLARGRVIFGDVVPYGEIWRTGANQATKITFSDDVQLEGKAVKAGTYALYTIPGKESWEVMLYKDLTMGGNVANYKNEDEVLRVTVKPVMNTRMVQSFTINMDNVAASSAKIQLSWEKTIVPIKLNVDVDTRVMKSIETVMKVEDSRPYFQAANYYYDNDKDLGQALVWADKAIAQNRTFFVVHLKAKIQMKMKNYDGAIKTAQESKRLAQEAKNDDYVRMNEKLIEKAKKS